MSVAPGEHRLDPLLDELRATGDPLADTLITRLGDTKTDINELLDLLDDIIRIDRSTVDELPIAEAAKVELRTFLDLAGSLPDWFDAGLIQRGAQMFRTHTFPAFVVLGCASLPACYCWRFEAQTLAETGRLIDGVPRRLPETAQMVLDVMRSGGIQGQPGQEGAGFGVQAARKVRLMHACIRYLQTRTFPDDMLAAFAASEQNTRLFAPYVRTDAAVSTATDVERAKINQEQLAATHLTFSAIILQGFKQFGIRTSTDEQRAYLHCWNVIGHLLGMDPRALDLTQNLDDAQVLLDRLMTRNRGPSADGAALETALLSYMQRNVRQLSPILYRLGAGRWPKIVTSLLIERDTQTAIGIQLSGFDRLMKLPLWSGLRAIGWLGNVPALRWIANGLFRFLSKRMWNWRVADTQDSEQSLRRARILVFPAAGGQPPHVS